MKAVRFIGITRILAAFMVLGALLAPASSAFAGGNGAQTFTQTFHNATDSFPSAIPCVNVAGTLNIVYNGVFHITVNKAGDFWGTGTETGTVTAVPTDPTLPTYTGHFTAWFGTSANNQNGVDHSTFSVHATGTDGSTINFSETQHMSMNANGVVVVSFDKPVCH